MKKLVYTVSIVLLAWSTFAQDLTDALRYSNYHISGTARSTAMGNAFGALGGDFSSLSINPAGAAVYRSGEFTFTSSVGKSSVDGNYLNNGSTATDSRYTGSINNIGYVTTIPTGANSETGLVSLSFGMGFNRLGGFSANMLAEGSNTNSSLLKYFTNNANNPYTTPDNLDPYYERLAWDTYLLNYDDQNKQYFNDISDNGYKQSVRKTTQREGHINEYLLAFAANFNHKLYIGGTLGIHDVYFKENASLMEFDANNNIPYFNDFNFNTSLSTSGYGFNVKLGAIYKPTTNLRLGLAIHTPTFYNLHDTYNSGMNSSITYVSDGKTEKYSAKPDKAGIYDYAVSTPLKIVFSGAYVIGKSGLISVDYEVVDYSTAKLNKGSDGYDFFDQNAEIKKAYRMVGNLHVGGEFRVDKNFSLRAGYENYPNAFNTSYLDSRSQHIDKPYSTISGGFGFKQGSFFFDAALQHVIDQQSIKLYPDANANEMIQYSTNQNNLIFTLGYKF
ncbi:MAG: hypothetical protein WCI54_11855 [Bacteroidia bacterium]|jgi:hypothetical protein